MTITIHPHVFISVFKELKEKRAALRQAEQWLQERRSELRGSMPRPRVGDTVVVCGASAETGVVTEDEGRNGLTVRLESGKGRRYREEEVLLHDAGGRHPSEQVIYLHIQRESERERHTHTHTHIYIYIYVFIFINFVCM